MNDIDTYNKIYKSVTDPDFDSLLPYVDIQYPSTQPWIKNIIDMYPSYTKDCLIKAIESDIDESVTFAQIKEVYDSIGWRLVDEMACQFDCQDDLILSIDTAIRQELNDRSGVD